MSNDKKKSLRRRDVVEREEFGDRGLASWYETKDLNANAMTISESSNAMEPSVRIYLDENVTYSGGKQARRCAHLSVEQARKTAQALSEWADMADAMMETTH